MTDFNEIFNIISQGIDYKDQTLYASCYMHLRVSCDSWNWDKRVRWNRDERVEWNRDKMVIWNRDKRVGWNMDKRVGWNRDERVGWNMM